MGPNKKDMQAKRSRGRPREYDEKIIIEEMLIWSLKETSLNFVGFCAEHGYLPSVIWRLQHEFEEFEEAYMLTRMRLADRREKMLNSEELNYGSWNRYQKHYDPFLDKHEEDDKDKDNKRRKDVAKQEGMNLSTLLKMASSGEIKQKD